MIITLLENGPIFINEPVIIDGKKLDKIALCRCGASDKKPLCDGSHQKCNFEGKQQNIELSE